jgi:hypothetical protein
MLVTGFRIARDHAPPRRNVRFSSRISSIRNERVCCRYRGKEVVRLE